MAFPLILMRRKMEAVGKIYKWIAVFLLILGSWALAACNANAPQTSPTSTLASYTPAPTIGAGTPVGETEVSREMPGTITPAPPVSTLATPEPRRTTTPSAETVEQAGGTAAPRWTLFRSMQDIVKQLSEALKGQERGDYLNGLKMVQNDWFYAGVSGSGNKRFGVVVWPTEGETELLWVDIGPETTVHTLAGDDNALGLLTEMLIAKLIELRGPELPGYERAPTVSLEHASPIEDTPSLAIYCGLTPEDAESHDYVPNAPRRESVGEGHRMQGVVWSGKDCSHIPDAKLEFWLAGPNGEYDDAHRATLYSDQWGFYNFSSNFPPPSDGGLPHIHIRVTADGYKTHTTRYQLRPGDTETAFDLVLMPNGE